MNTNLYLLLARISPRTMLLVCLALAGLAVFCYSSEIERRDKIAKAELGKVKDENARTAKVLTATRDLREGDMLHMDDVRLETIRESAVPAGAVQDLNSAIGMRVKFDISAGTAIPNAALGTLKQPDGFEAKIPSGYRAVTFAVDNSSGVAGFVAPESHVDVIAQVGSGADVKSCPLLADVRIIAAGTTYKRVPGQEGAQPVSSVTVAVNPTDARKLIDAIAAGKLYLTLRNDGDHAPLAVHDVNSLFPKKEVVPFEDNTIIPPPKITVLPPAMPKFDKLEEPTMASKLPVPPVLHTVELWSGSKKDEFAVSQ